MDADDVAVIADLEIKGRAFLDAMEAARPALERMRMAAARTRISGGLLSETTVYSLDSAARERRYAQAGGRRRGDVARGKPGAEPDQ